MFLIGRQPAVTEWRYRVRGWLPAVHRFNRCGVCPRWNRVGIVFDSDFGSSPSWLAILAGGGRRTAGLAGGSGM
jgi:hypothetical protein